VDFKDPERPRIPKESAKYLTKVFADNGFPVTATNDEKKLKVSANENISWNFVEDNQLE